MISKRVENIIHNCIKEIWMNEIQTDYTLYRLLKEDSLKNAFYHHLRSRLGDTFLDEHGLYIWTEFNDGPLKGTGKRADLAIVQLSNIDDTDYLGNAVENVVAIFELKYKATYTAVREIQGDVAKLQSYIEDDGIDCRYYLAAIREITADQDQYLDDSAGWAVGKVTELLASYTDDEQMEFRTIDH